MERDQEQIWEHTSAWAGQSGSPFDTIRNTKPNANADVKYEYEKKYEYEHFHCVHHKLCLLCYQQHHIVIIVIIVAIKK